MRLYKGRPVLTPVMLFDKNVVNNLIIEAPPIANSNLQLVELSDATKSQYKCTGLTYDFMQDFLSDLTWVNLSGVVEG